jgi:hypothetical protein
MFTAMHRAPRLILTGLDLDLFADGEGNARRQSAAVMTRAANDAATTTRPIAIVCRMTIRAICQRGRVEAPAGNDSRGSPVHVLGRDTPKAHPARQKPIEEFVSERLRRPSPAQYLKSIRHGGGLRAGLLVRHASGADLGMIGGAPG